MVLFSLFIYMMDYIDIFLCVEQSMNLWDEADLIMVDDFFDVFLNLLQIILLSIFASMFMSEIGL